MGKWKWVKRLRVLVKKAFCRHAWKRISDSKFHPKLRRWVTTSRTGICTRCGHTMAVDNWDKLPGERRAAR